MNAQMARHMMFPFFAPPSSSPQLIRTKDGKLPDRRRPLPKVHRLRKPPQYNAPPRGMRECMKKWLIALVCASAFLPAQNALAAIKFKRFAHCGDGLVTVKTCECHASNSRVWHYCHAGYYCHTFDGSCRK
jgi:hypothetical protein